MPGRLYLIRPDGNGGIKYVPVDPDPNDVVVETPPETPPPPVKATMLRRVYVRPPGRLPCFDFPDPYFPDGTPKTHEQVAEEHAANLAAIDGRQMISGEEIRARADIVTAFYRHNKVARAYLAGESVPRVAVDYFKRDIKNAIDRLNADFGRDLTYDQACLIIDRVRRDVGDDNAI